LAAICNLIIDRLGACSTCLDREATAAALQSAGVRLGAFEVQPVRKGEKSSSTDDGRANDRQNSDDPANATHRPAARRAVSAIGPGKTLFSGKTFLTLRPGGTRRTHRTIDTGRTLFALKTLQTLLALFALRPTRTLFSLRTFKPLFALDTRRPLRTHRPLRTFRTRFPCACFAYRTLFTGRTHGPLRTRLSGLSLWTFWSFITLLRTPRIQGKRQRDGP
jgi:hypothetical protein